MGTLRSVSKEFFNKHLFMTVICITYLLSFSSGFRRFKMKNLLRRPTMVADNISLFAAPQNNSVHWGYHPPFPPSPPPLIFLAKPPPPLNLQTVQALSF